MSPSAEQTADTRAKAAQEPEIALPVELLRNLDLQGELTMDSVTVNQIPLTDILMKTQAKAGVVRVDPLQLNIPGGTVNLAFAYAKPFLDVVGDVCMGWMHLWRATVALPKLEKLAGSLDPAARLAKAAESKEAAYYEGVLQSAKFYINTVLPVTLGKMNTIKNCDAATVEIPEAAFGG